MTVMYARPFPRPVPSTPIARNPSNMHGIGDSSRPATRPAMSPAVLHAICGKPLTVFWPATVISHAHSDPKSRVNRPPGPAHGTRETTTPCGRHSTRGTGPESPTRKQPKSWCRQLRPPPPLSYLGAFRPQREQRNAPFPHLTRATGTGASRSGESSNDTSSTIMSLTFSNRLNMLFNQGAFLGCILGRKTNLQEAPLTPSYSTAQRRATTHENNTRASNFIPPPAHITIYSHPIMTSDTFRVIVRTDLLAGRHSSSRRLTGPAAGTGLQWWPWWAPTSRGAPCTTRSSVPVPCGNPYAPGPNPTRS